MKITFINIVVAAAAAVSAAALPQLSDVVHNSTHAMDAALEKGGPIAPVIAFLFAVTICGVAMYRWVIGPAQDRLNVREVEKTKQAEAEASRTIALSELGDKLNHVYNDMIRRCIRTPPQTAPPAAGASPAPQAGSETTTARASR